MDGILARTSALAVAAGAEAGCTGREWTGSGCNGNLARPSAPAVAAGFEPGCTGRELTGSCCNGFLARPSAPVAAAGAEAGCTGRGWADSGREDSEAPLLGYLVWLYASMTSSKSICQPI